MDHPAVSVIVPCYNLGDFVEEAVDSVLAQTYQDFEIIIVNDGSTDPHTNDVLNRLDRPRTTVLTTANRGLPTARNHGIERARGRYICALDADDKLHPKFLERTISLLDRDPSVAFVSTWLECFGIENWVWRQERCDFPKLLAECVVLTAAPVRREAVEAVGGYDCERYLFGSEDWDLWISMVERGLRGVILPEVLFYYRQRGGSMRRVSDQPPTRGRVWQSLLEKHRSSYERYLPEVLLLMEDECGRLLLENWMLECEVQGRLQPMLENRRAELMGLQAKLAAIPQPDAADIGSAQIEKADREVMVALEAARAEIAALRSSWSWRITAPLREACDLWLALTRAASRSRPRSE